MIRSVGTEMISEMLGRFEALSHSEWLVIMLIKIKLMIITLLAINNVSTNFSGDRPLFETQQAVPSNLRFGGALPAKLFDCPKSSLAAVNWL